MQPKGPMLYPSPMPAPVVQAPARPEAVAIQGKRVQLLTRPDAGNLIAVPTTLISARVNAPREWVITLMQIVRRSGATPWEMVGGASEGGGTWSAANVTAPQLPNRVQALQVALIWAAGGASFNTRLDYPAMGGTFGVVADTLDLSVVFKADPASSPYSSLDDVPVIGAFMVEGRAADATSLRWLEAAGSTGGAASAFYTVKPYARRVRVSFKTSAVNGSAGNSALSFVDTAGVARYVRVIPAATQEVVVDVPAQAVGMSVDTSVANTFDVEWQIGLV